MATFWWWLAAAAVAAAVIAALLVWLPMRRRRALLEQEAERLALRIQALEQERDEQRRHLEQQGQQWRQTEEKLSVARAEQARLEERLAGQQDKLRFAEESREQLRKEFELLAGRIFEQRSRSASS